MAPLSVAVIGAGPAGLAAAKAALEAGLRPTVFEPSLSPGGIWAPWTGAAWPGMTTNLSRFTCAFSDHPWPEPAPDFPAQARVYGYLQSYSDRFDVAARIRLGCLVTGVGHSGDRWAVRWRDAGSDGSRAEDFDAVVVASGFFARPVRPREPGHRAYRGRSRHSSEYRSPGDYVGHRVVIVGMAFSGAEIATELASSDIDVTIVASRPMWILPRYLTDPLTAARVPLDLVLYRRPAQDAATTLSSAEANRRRHHYLRQIGTNPGEIHPDLRIDPATSDPAYVLISDALPSMVKSGAIRVRAGRVTGLSESGVVLSAGIEVPADTVIWCGGYQAALPFLGSRQRELVRFEPADRLQPMTLYQCTFHPGLPRMAFVGMYKGPFFAVMELQARWFAAILTGQCAAPDRGVMMAGLAQEMHIREVGPRPQFPHGDYVGLADGIARELGVLPDLGASGEHGDWVRNGPVVAAHYRLRGPHSDPVAARWQMEHVVRRIRRQGSTPMREEASVEDTSQAPPAEVAKEIFDSLPGRWILRRQIPGFGVMTGTARFRTVHGAVLLYREDGILRHQDGRSLRAYREYFYVLEERQIRIAFAERGKPGGTLHSLVFAARAESAWPAHASDTHRCGEDVYAGDYLFLRDGRIEVRMMVQGPRKDHVIQTVLQRDERSGASSTPLIIRSTTGQASAPRACTRQPASDTANT
jgi:dimethylaniline monooxygenase (N-oxide forming)